MSERTLTDADVEAIVDKLKADILDDIYGGVGKGILFWVKRTIIYVIIAFAIYGMAVERGALHAVSLPGVKQ